MHDIKNIETNLQFYKENLAKRNFDVQVLDEVIVQNVLRKNLTTEVEKAQSQVKSLSKEIGPLKKAGKDASELMAQVAEAKSIIETNNTKLEEVQNELNNLLAGIPNLIDDSVPKGKSEDDNIEVRKWGAPKKFNFKVSDHADLGEKLGMLDFETAAAITGARFVVYKKQLARMERALANFMLDHHLDNGYEEVIPPFIVHERSLYGTGQLPKFGEDLFKLEGTDWYLIPTAEVPVTNLKREKIFDQAELPFKYAAYTPCFRSEAGSHGKDTRGLIRMHQFNKVEMVNIVHPDDSDKALEDMTNSAEQILQKLDLPYRVMALCSADIGFGSRKTYDMEVWIPSQEKYREISSCSNCGDFQSRRASIRFKKQGEKPQFAHTLNGSGLAVGRTLVAIMENYQNEDGSITVPDALVPYMGGLTRVEAK